MDTDLGVSLTRPRVLFLDDDDRRHALFQRRMANCDVSVAFTTQEAIRLLNAHSPYDVVYLDHDLGEISDDPPYGEVTGRVVADHIANILTSDKHPVQVVIHSWNIEGSRRMRDTLRDAGLTVTLAPFGTAAP